MSQYQGQSDGLLSPGGNNNTGEGSSGTHTPYSDIVTKEEELSGGAGGDHYANGGSGAAEAGGHHAHKKNFLPVFWRWILIGAIIVAGESPTCAVPFHL